MRGLIQSVVSFKRGTVTVPPAVQANVDAEVRELIVLLRTAKGGGVSEGFAGVLRYVAQNGPAIERGLVAWVELVEILIQGAEQRYPNGYGPLKKAQVRAAVHAIFAGADVMIPGVARDLEPLLMDILLDWFIDALVNSLEAHALWDASLPEPWSFAGFWRAALARLLRLIAPAAAVLNWLYVRLRYSEPLTPEVALAVQRVRASGLIADKSRLTNPVAQLIRFAGEHRVEMTASVAAFFEVVTMAERLATLTGAQKKAYATAIVTATLEELGFPVEGGLLGAIANALISFGIESALRLFQKRAPEAFRGGQPTGSS
jgi:hypothetical protein